MADTTPRLDIELMESGESYPHLTFNDLASRMDVLTMPALAGYPASASPDTIDVSEGDLYIVPPNAEGNWGGQDDKLAYYQNAAWNYIKPSTGWIVSAPDNGTFNIYNVLRYYNEKWTKISYKSFSHVYLGNHDPGAGGVGEAPLAINYDHSKSALIGPMYIKKATTGENMAILGIKNITDYSMDLWLYNMIDAQPAVKISSYGENYFK
ncbi:MAG: DUF2793 domain-containing protein, partial [Planctomycetes bacterium]|nr:DUF2793 domain-containing protein [Planctomycetota bacterium]